jgi:hypothetical protein
MTLKLMHSNNKNNNIKSNIEHLLNKTKVSYKGYIIYPLNIFQTKCLAAIFKSFLLNLISLLDRAMKTAESKNIKKE